MAKSSAFGAKLQYFNVSFIDVAYVRDISGPGLSSDVVDVTSHDSTNGWREKLPTLKDGGEVTLDLVFDPADTAGQQALRTVGSDPATFRLVFADSGTTTWEFSAITTGFEVNNPVEGEISASATLTVTGEPDFAAA